MSVTEQMVKVAEDAKSASRTLARLSSAVKNELLQNMAQALLNDTEVLIEENEKDLVAAREAGLAPAMVDRLALDAQRIRGMADGLCEVADLPDPVGEVTGMWRRPNDLQIGRIKTVPGQQALNMATVRIVADAGHQADRQPQFFQVIGEIKRRSAKAPVIRKYIKQDFTDYQNHNCSFLLDCLKVLRRSMMITFFQPPRRQAHPFQVQNEPVLLLRRRRNCHSIPKNFPRVNTGDSPCFFATVF